MSASRVPLSVLDLSVLVDGATSADALATTTALARRSDELGFTRFWVAEHHNMPSVACTAPTVLIAHLAALTERIRLGSGGVMLPNHAPLVVAEQFAMLEAMHPHRIDVGVGRAPGTDQSTAAALRRSPDVRGAEDFPQQLIDLIGLLGDPRTEQGMWDRFRATPVATTYPQVFLLGSSGFSAQLAGQLGLGFGFAHHFDMGGTLQAADLYRSSFRPSASLEAPYMIVTANVLVADTTEEAEWHGAPGRLTALGRRTGRFIPLPSPTDSSRHPDIDQANRLPSNRIIGDPATSVAQLESLAQRTGADELMVTAVAFDLSARVRSLELLAEHWGLDLPDQTR
ncbi:MAG: putative Monooxygenase [Acidimicrobiales bacterium]|nr:putative Monooxygenase [Acidimicrobiales bacterium]